MWELDHKENRAPKNWCLWTVVLEKTLESPLDCKEILKSILKSILKEISPKYSSEGLMLKLKLHTLATWYEEVTHLKRPWCCERLKAGGEGDNRGWDGRIASLTQWTWVWVDSGSLWWTGNAEEWRMKNESGYWPYRKWKDYKGTSWTIVCQHIRWLFLSTKNEKETLSTHSMKPKTPWKC